LFYPFIDKDMLLWCKAALHSEEPVKFDISKYLTENDHTDFSEVERSYLKTSGHDFWLEMSQPEAPQDF
jgi:hypothetical protein